MLVAISVIDGLRVAARLATSAVVVAIGFMVVTPLIGRVPWGFSVLGTLIAAIATGVRFGPGEGVQVDRARPAWCALGVLCLQSLLWMVLGTTLICAALIAVAAVMAASTAMGFRAAVQMDEAALRVGKPILQPVRRLVSGITRWWVRPSTASSRWAGVIAVVMSAPVFWRLASSEELLVRGTNDFEAHVRRAEAITLSPFFMSVPHPGWHITFLGVETVVGRQLGIVLIGSIAMGVLVGLLASLGRSDWDDVPPMNQWLAGIFGLSYLLMENIGQLVPRGESWWQRLDIVGLRARGPSFYPIHLWGSPTITLSLPLALLMTLLVLLSVRGDLDRARRHRLALLVTTLITTMVLPAATLVLVPAVPVYLVISGRLTRDRLAVLVPFFLIPGALVCVFQTMFLASGVSSFERTGWRWNPGWIIRYVGMDRPVFWLVVLIAPAGCWLLGRRFFGDPAVGLSGAAFIIALLPMLLLQQTAADKAADGDLGMPALFAAIFFVVFASRMMLVELVRVWNRRREQPISPAAVTGALVLALMLCAGAIDYLSATGVIPEI